MGLKQKARLKKPHVSGGHVERLGNGPDGAAEEGVSAGVLGAGPRDSAGSTSWPGKQGPFGTGTRASAVSTHEAAGASVTFLSARGTFLVGWC